MLYKVGDKVRVKPLEELKDCSIVVKAMFPYAGQLVTISEVANCECYFIVEDNDVFYWNDECFIGLDEEYIEDEEGLTEKTVDEKLEHLRETVDSLLITVSELETRVSELERKLEQVIRDV